ncbi:acyl-CoA N-acyltransferase [Hypoxylon sp. NC1633]|nr:acyl-CoA N-acyltransferase [Hypoxylon sp. NC1633]
MSKQATIKVKTHLPTRPWPSNTEKKPIRTERLIMRPYAEEDLEDIYILRTQPEVMVFTAVGRGDADRDESRAYMARYLPPNDVATYNTIICLASTGEVIGTGGLTKNNTFGWPEVGYMLKKEYWGKGFATEFLRGFLSHWWSLPRSELELEVDAQSVDGTGEAPEIVTAVIDADNLASRRVLEKLGFREIKRWSEADSREGYPGDVSLIGFSLSLSS